MILNQTRKSNVFAVSTLGAIFGAVVMSYFHIQLIGFLEALLSPPLHSIGNFGQYGVVFLTLGFWGAILGAFTGLLGRMRTSDWYFVYFCAISLISLFHIKSLLEYGFFSTFTCATLIMLNVIPLPSMTIVVVENLLLSHNMKYSQVSTSTTEKTLELGDNPECSRNGRATSGEDIGTK